MASVAVPGIMNKKGAKPPRPKASSSGFHWPSTQSVRDEHRRSFAIFLAKKMREKKYTHITLAKYLWGMTKVGGTAGSTVVTWLRLQKLPSPKTAGYLAEHFGVSMEQMLQETGDYAFPSDIVVNAKGQQLNVTPTPTAATKAKKKNGHAHPEPVDQRWLLPKGVDQPAMKIDTSGKDGLNKIEIKATVPPQVTMAIFAMLHEYKRE